MDRIQIIEKKFGSPWKSENPLGFSAILKADENNSLLAAGEAMLDEFGLNAEFVPTALGGRLHALDHFIDIMRAVYRHDPCLGLGYGISSFISAVNIWTAGNFEQNQQAARLLLENKKIACSYYELLHGNDLTGCEFQAAIEHLELTLNGSKHISANIERAQAVVIFAKTATGSGSRQHSQLFIDKSLCDPKAIRYLPRFKTVGMRGVPLGGIDVVNAKVPSHCILGSPGQGLETALKSFQVTRTALPGIFTGILDTGLRIVMDYAQNRYLYAKTIVQLPHPRRVLVECFIDLLICDCLSTIVARAVHLLPKNVNLYSATVKYFVPKILIDAMQRLSAILGSRFYLRSGEQGIFQKFLRDLKPVLFGHGASVVCQMSILQQLPTLARYAWFSQTDTTPSELFQLDAELPVLAFDQLQIGLSHHDPLMATLLSGLNKLVKCTGITPSLKKLLQNFVTELGQLMQACLQLTPQKLTVMADASTYDLVKKYSVVLSAGKCLNVWLNNQLSVDNFLKNEAWLFAVLQRLSTFLSGKSSAIDQATEEYLFNELNERYLNNCSFDLKKIRFPW